MGRERDKEREREREREGERERVIGACYFGPEREEDRYLVVNAATEHVTCKDTINYFST